MTKPPDNPFGMPNLGLPNFGFPNPLAGLPFSENSVAQSFAGGLDFLKTLWGGASNSALPSMAGFVAPTLDLGELDRKISDLKSVETWLASNAAMLRATVQALEVQRNTIAMLQSFASNAPSSAAAKAHDPAAARAAAGLPKGWPVSGPATEHASGPSSSAPLSSAPSAPSESPEPRKAEAASQSAAPPDRAASRKSSKKAAAPSADGVRTVATQAANAGIANAAAWWNLLQEQFAKVAHAAVAADPAERTSPPSKVRRDEPVQGTPRAGKTAPAKAPNVASKPSSVKAPARKKTRQTVAAKPTRKAVR